MRIARSGHDALEEDKSEGSLSRFVRHALALSLGLSLSAMAAMQAEAASRTISMYHVHTKERITVTYWKDGRFIPSALRKLNWFLRDWRRNIAVRIDPRTIDLVWKLHRDLGSKEVIHIISGHRSAKTNAMLRRIGRRVARRSRHITGQAIDFKFPDVPTWKVRNLALAYGIGGVGYYGRNGFVHVDTGKVRHWPRLPQRKYAAIVRQYRKYIGRGWKRHGGDDRIMVAARSTKKTNFNRNSSLQLARAQISELKRKIAAAEKARTRAGTKTTKRTAKGLKGPVPLPGAKPLPPARPAVQLADNRPAAPLPKARPYQVLVLAAARMEVTPAAAPATITNFARPDSARDPIGVVIANLPPQEFAPPTPRPRHESHYPRVRRDGKGDLAIALVNGQVANVPTLDRMNGASGKGDLLVGAAGMRAEDMVRRNGAPVLGAGHGAMQAATSAFWPAPSGVQRRHGRVQRVNRAEKGDLLTTAALPPMKLRKAALRYGAMQTADMQPLSFR